MNINKGDRVQVNFIGDSSTEFSGIHFTGTGTIDLSEDGYIYGRLDDGRTFMCNESDCKLIKTDYVCLGKASETGFCKVVAKGEVLNPYHSNVMHCFCGGDNT